MPARKKSSSLREDYQALDEWAALFRDLLNYLELDPSSWGRETYVARPAARDLVERRVAELQRKTGRVAAIVVGQGVAVSHKPAGTMARQTIDGITPWTTMFDTFPIVTPRLVLDCCNRALGGLEDDIREAETHEGSFEGRIESWVDVPRRLWRALRGAPGAVRDSPSAFWSGMITGVLSGLFVVWITHVLAWP